MATEYLVCVFSILTGIAQGQIITSPENATGIIGGNVTFHCELDFTRFKLMIWEHDGSGIYDYQIDEGKYNINGGKYGLHHNKYNVLKDGENFTLTVQKLEWSDVGIYTCRQMSLTADATLIILDTPYLIDSTIDESNLVSYACIARFGGPIKDKITPRHFPQLTMHSGPNILPVSVNKSRDGSDHQYYLLWQIYHITPDLEGQMQGKTLTCDISTSYPEESLSTEITIIIPEKPSSTTRLVTTRNEVTADPRNNPVPGSEEVKVLDSSNRGLVIIAVVLDFLILSILCVIGAVLLCKFGSNPSCFEACKKKKSVSTDMKRNDDSPDPQPSTSADVHGVQNDDSPDPQPSILADVHGVQNDDSPDPQTSISADVHGVQEAKANSSTDAGEQSSLLHKSLSN